MTQNDMPGELRDKIKLWEVLNKILKNNGFIDADNIISDIANLKQQLNVLLSDVLGLEHEIDGVHNYDDTSLKTKLDTLQNTVTTSLASMNTDIESLMTRLTGINTTSTKIELLNRSRLYLSTFDENYNGTELQMLPGQIYMQAREDPVTHGVISLSGGVVDSSNPHGNGGVEVLSDNYVNLGLRTDNHYIKIEKTSLRISDVNGLVIEPDGTAGVKIRDYAHTKICHIPWES
jgi:hypothetical protein